MRSRRTDLMAFVALLFAAAAVALSLNAGSLLSAQGISGAPAAAPDAPIGRTFSYQGVLRDAGGKLLNGEYAIIARIYADPAGGGALYANSYDKVRVRDGIFNIVLGEPATLSDAALADTKRFIGIQVGTDLQHMDPEMTPRQRLHPVPWALRASAADTANSATTAGSAAEAAKLITNATTNGLTVTGKFTTEDLTLKGYREIITQTGAIATPAPSAPPYQVNARRWLLEVEDQDTRYNPLKLDEKRLEEYCIDEDGCRVSIGMRNWASASFGQGMVALVGPYTWSLSQKGSNPSRPGQRFYEIRSLDGTNYSIDGRTNGWDNDGFRQNVFGGWNCFLQDGAHTNGVAGTDNEEGFYLLNYETDWTANDMTCVLIIED